MLFTDANVDHIGGLATLRQDGEHRFVLRSSAVVRAIATRQTAFSRFAQPPHRWLEVPLDGASTPDAGDSLGDNGFEIRAIPVAGTTPGYDGRRPAAGAVVAYEIAQVKGTKRLLFAPVFASIDEPLAVAIATADVAFLDGTFFSDGELLIQELMPKRAGALGHLAMDGPGGTLAALAGATARIVFTHINNSNPILNPDSDAARRVRAANFEVAYDGMELRL
jgi:pyrroloquinoline quinone biosynthesis protein B